MSIVNSISIRRIMRTEMGFEKRFEYLIDPFVRLNILFTRKLLD